MKSYYQNILGVSELANKEQITIAYRKMSEKYNEQSPHNEVIQQTLLEAYNYLTIPECKEYVDWIFETDEKIQRTFHENTYLSKKENVLSTSSKSTASAYEWLNWRQLIQFVTARLKFQI